MNPSRFATTLMMAGILGALGVIIGAFGGHGLGDFLAAQYDDAATIAKRTEQFEIGVRYHMVHAGLLLGLALLARPLSSDDTSTRSAGATVLGVATWLTVAGTFLFSGSLYLLVMSGKTWLGMVTPLGGVSWIVAWTLVAVFGWKQRRG